MSWRRFTVVYRDTKDRQQRKRVVTATGEKSARRYMQRQLDSLFRYRGLTYEIVSVTEEKEQSE